LEYSEKTTSGAAAAAPTENVAKFSAYTAARVQFWTEFAGSYARWQRARGYYQKRLADICSLLIPPGMRVLEVGCGRGDLLAALRPAYGVGVDFCPAILESARREYPKLNFVSADAHNFELGETFDYIVCSDLLNDVWDVQDVFANIGRHCHAGTRLILNSYSRLWELPRRLAEGAGLAKPQLKQNWLAPGDILNLLHLADFESIRYSQEILWPFRTPPIHQIANKYLVKVTPFRWLALANVIVARPKSRSVSPEPMVSVVVAARNEAGNIPHIFDRVPAMGAGTELIFVEGGSKDDTWGAIEREMARRPHLNAKLFRQQGRGKGDAVRKGFSEASGDVLMILDADMTVAPEDLPRFYEAWRSGKAEFVNGVRLVYPMEDHAMRFFNHVGNKFFSLAFTWLLSQSIKDTLCGTKVLSRRNYEMIAANRGYFGEIDPFGDFDLIFGAAKYNLKIVDLPIRYGDRTYGETNIQRWSHGMLLIRMVIKAMRKIKFV
jgi:ubiquinone/menaquinone biosynthesis C-methylase UbiE